MSEPVVRPLTAADGGAARALVQSTYAGSPYLSRTLELLDVALRADDRECVGIAHATDADVDAILVHGVIAGAAGVEKLHVVVANDPAGAAALIDALCHQPRWRMIVCELPEDALHARTSKALTERGFTREGSVAAFFDDRTDLTLYVLRRGAQGG